jgi:lipopolysaccharide transport system ATP-binding protein
MSRIVIKIENLSKEYRLGTIGRGTLIGDVQSWWARVRGKEDPNTRITLNLSSSASPSPISLSGEDRFWALKDVSLDVEQGEIVGIIGRNGAGKSTLLKIMSQVTAPTKGLIKIKGRVASLLEVGTGFHPELTGRENVYLNGTILGMTRKEIDQKFDEIVAFAETGKFIDTPVKRYSSGMYVRLAFAVAAHLESEILVVDEVLAVGDSAFQKKCLGKMETAGREGRTVLFVSHNMAAISALCKKAVTLKNGQMMTSLIEVNKAIDFYLSSLETQTEDLSSRKDRQGEGKIRITEFGIFDRQGNKLNTLISGQYTEFRIYYECVSTLHPRNISVAIGVSSISGVFLALLSNEMADGSFESIGHSGYWACEVDRLPFAPIKLSLNLIVRQNNIIQDWIQNAVSVVVESGDFYGTGKVTEQSHGGFLMEQKWSSTFID